MAKLGQAAIVREQKKAEKEVNALQRKMELQAKKSEFGEGWRKAVGTERQKEMLDLICSKGAPKVLDSLDYNLFIEPIEFYKDKDTGEINKFDYQAYLDAEKAYESGIEEQDLILADEDDVVPDIMDKIKKGKKTAKDKKKENNIKVPEYLQKCYTLWNKYFGRYFPLYNKYVCTCCGRPLNIGEYYLNYNEMDLGRVEIDGKMHTHICIDCCKRLYEYLYFEKAGKDAQVAMMWFCSALNIYYDETIYLQAKQESSKKDKKLHIVDAYMKIMNQSATAKGKVFLESKDIKGFAGKNASGDENSKDKRIIESEDGSVRDDTEDGWNKQDLEAKRIVLKIVGYDPFYYELDETRKVLYKDLLGMLESGMEMDGLKVQAAVQIVLAFSRIRELNERERKMMSGDGSVAELKNLADLKNKQLDTITKFSRDNGFRERYAQARSKRENSFTGIMAKMGEQKYEKALVNVYDIETSKTIQAAADASFRAIFSQLNTSEAEIYKTCGEQLKRLVTLQRDLDSTQEQLRLAKAELARIRLEEAKKESDANDSVVGEWGGY